MPAATVPTPTSGTSVIQQTLASEAYRIAGDVWSYTYSKSPWARILPREEFPTGMGGILTSLHYERALVGTTNGKGTWNAHLPLGASSNPIGQTPPDISQTRGLPPVSVMQASASQVSYNLVWTAIESLRFNSSDAAFDYRHQDQVAQIYKQLINSSARVWSLRVREDYFRLANNKYILGINATGATTSVLADLSVVAPQDFSGLVQYSLAQLNATGAAPANGFSAAHSVLTNGILRDIYSRLCIVGAGDNSGAMSDGCPVFNLVTSAQTSDYLIREPGTRSDLRFGKASELLKPLGVERSINGFAHVIDMEPPRFTLALSGSLYDFTEVFPWVYQAGSLTTTISAAATYASGTQTILTVASSNGIVPGQPITIAPTSAADDEFSGTFIALAIPSSTTVVINLAFTDTMTGVLTTQTNGQGRWVQNTAYHSAPYEMSYILHPEMMATLMTRPPTTIGSGSRFDAREALGEFKFLNIPNEINNPDGTFGYWRGILEFAAKPMKQEYGWAIIHRRPDPVYAAAPVLGLIQGLGLTS